MSNDYGLYMTFSNNKPIKFDNWVPHLPVGLRAWSHTSVSESAATLSLRHDYPVPLPAKSKINVSSVSRTNFPPAWLNQDGKILGVKEYTDQSSTGHTTMWQHPGSFSYWTTRHEMIEYISADLSEIDVGDYGLLIEGSDSISVFGELSAPPHTVKNKYQFDFAVGAWGVTYEIPELQIDLTQNTVPISIFVGVEGNTNAVMARLVPRNYDYANGADLQVYFIGSDAPHGSVTSNPAYGSGRSGLIGWGAASAGKLLVLISEVGYKIGDVSYGMAIMGAGGAAVSISTNQVPVIGRTTFTAPALPAGAWGVPKMNFFGSTQTVPSDLVGKTLLFPIGGCSQGEMAYGHQSFIHQDCVLGHPTPHVVGDELRMSLLAPTHYQDTPLVSNGSIGGTTVPTEFQKTESQYMVISADDYF